MHAIAFLSHLGTLEQLCAPRDGHIEETLVITAFTRACRNLEALREEARLMTGARRDAAFEEISHYSTLLCRRMEAMVRAMAFFAEHREAVDPLQQHLSRALDTTPAILH